MSDEERDLSGEYTLRTGMFAGGVQHAPGAVVTLPHAEAKRLLELGAVEDPAKDPEGDPHTSADRILSRAEFLRWMDIQYPRYVDDRIRNRDRNRLFDQLRNKAVEVQANPPAPPAMPDTSDPVVSVVAETPAPSASEPAASPEAGAVQAEAEPTVAASPAVASPQPPAAESAPPQGKRKNK